MKHFAKAGRLAVSVLLAAAVAAATGVPALADTSAVSDFTLPAVTGPYNVNAGVGSNPTQLNFSWFTQSAAAAQIKIAPASKLQNGALPASAAVQNAVQQKATATESINQATETLADITGVPSAANYNDNATNGKTPAPLFTGEYSNKATVKGLSPSTAYAYSVSDGKGDWSPVYTVSTMSSSAVSFAAFGDPQIGAFDDADGTAKSDTTGGHKSVTDDETGWGKMLSFVSQIKGLNFLFTMGDQVNDYNYLGSGLSAEDGQWNQYNYFFNPNGKTVIQSFPLAVFSGNHDHQMGEYYGYHYNQPNLSSLGATQYGNDGDYWFTAGPVLFLVLNANNAGTADHDQFIAQAVKANPDARWKVAAWHQSAYSEASHNIRNTADDPVLTIRNTWPHMMDKYGIDVVLQGHDHYYTRTAQMYDGNVIDPSTGNAVTPAVDTGSSIPGTANANATYATKDYPNSVTDPKGTVYFTLDSGSGSKYYNLQTGTNDTVGGGTDHTFSVVGWQGYTPTYSLVTFTNSTFTIKTYSTGDFASQQLIDSYTITKTAASTGGNTTSSGSGTTSSSAAATSSSKAANPQTGSNGDFAVTLISFLCLALLLGGISFVILRQKRESAGR